MGPMQFTPMDNFHIATECYLENLLKHLLNHKMPETDATTRKHAVIDIPIF